MDFFKQIMVPGLEIAIIWMIIYYLLMFFWNTRAMDLIFGLLAFVIIYTASNWLHLPVLQKTMHYFVNVAVIALIIIFQPELAIGPFQVECQREKI